jgi:endonuclease/exonuclease/phosphatase (EEP) superfamily protein YafD
VLVLGLLHEALIRWVRVTAAAVAVLVVLVWCAWPGRAIVRPFGKASTIAALEDGFPVRAPSPVAQAAAQLPPDALLASNVPANLYLDGGRASIFLPPQINLVAGKRNQDYQAQLQQLGRIFAARHGYVVMYPDFNPALAQVGDLERAMKLVEVGRYSDGVIYRVDPPD